jgi:hypothetical protein
MKRTETDDVIYLVINLVVEIWEVKLVSGFDLVPFYFFLILFCWSPCSYFLAALLLLLVSSWCSTR